jgi:rhodanese-related sulfurtransferase
MSFRILALLALGLVAGCTKESGGSHAGAAAKPLGKLEQVGAQEFKALAEQMGGLYLDVRTPDEVARGHLPNASVIDINDPRFDQKLAVMQKDKPIFVYCASGARSSAASEMMIRMGFTQVYNLLGGIGSWANAGYPIERSAEALRPSGEGAMLPAAFDRTLASEKRLLVDFHTPWCAPCRRMVPVVDAVAEAWKGKAAVLKVDVDQSEALAQREKISGVPVLVLYIDGKERWRRSGETSREVLDAELAKP